jgi:hypothetical protein
LELGLGGVDDLVGEEVGVGDVGGDELVESVDGCLLVLLARHVINKMIC